MGRHLTTSFRSSKRNILLRFIKGSTLVLLICIAFFTGCNSDSRTDKNYASATDTLFRINFQFDDVENKMMIAEYESVNGDVMDTVQKNEKGFFIFTGSLKEPQLMKFRLIDDANASENSFYMENNNLDVTGKWNDRKSWKWKGSQVPADYDEYEQQTNAISSKISSSDSLIGVYQESNMDTEAIELVKKLDMLLKEKREITKKFIADHPRSPVSLNQLLLNFYANATPLEIKETYELLDSTVKQMPDGKYFFKEVLTPALNTDIGRVAPDFSLPDRNGKSVSLANYKGKYVLIDFWASWCVPCRKAIPELRQLYDKYKSQSFELLSISLDNRKESWLAAMDQDKHTWTSLGDGKGFQSPVAAIYGVKAIPYTIMINKNGKVLARNPSLGTIEEILLNALSSGK